VVLDDVEIQQQVDAVAAPLAPAAALPGSSTDSFFSGELLVRSTTAAVPGCSEQRKGVL
jgi:hypothetical protein